MTAQPGISATSAPPNTVVQVQPGMNVQPVVLVDQNGQYVTASTATALATTTAPVNVGNATAPTSGQVLTATSGTAATWQPVSAELPLTTLGDTLYENATPTPARLAGNTTATKNFLTQTGTGAVSAAPAWGTIASSDLPTGTTSAKGALQLDGTATDIQPTGTQSAGSVGKPADAGHVHFSSGMYLCAPSIYAPTAQTRLAVSSTTLAPFNSAPTTVAAGSNGGEISQIAAWSSPSAGVLSVASTTGYPPSGTLTVAASGATTAVITYAGTSGGNSFTGCAYVSGSATGTVATGGAVTLTSVTLQTNSFTAPASGSVLVTLHCALQVGTTADSVMLALEQSGTIYGYTATYALSGSGVPGVATVLFYVTGLNAGNSYQFQLYGAATTAISATIYAQGLTATGVGNNGAPVVMTVQAV